MSSALHMRPPTTGPELRDIHLPPGPSWWPPAPGWWLLALALLALAFTLAWWWGRRHRRRVAEHALSAEVDALLARHRGQPQRLAAGLHQLLRRGALRHDTGAARRQGPQWRNTLAMVPMDAATLDRLMSLESAMYRPDASFDIDATAAATRHWLVLSWRHRQRGKPASKAATPVVAEESPHA
ncbi:DUF4381 domain-containing protein [Dyella soli]|uniref:DUF4381 domain-containing protein n=1 Tax=Dyella soli TaxID=522319 RepID=A0A4R0YMT5_9GAMM|nr:DUF4381 domain-containing protein [Dyella soli]TCI07109.1 DUF4381 domain-containing protein [Dyella soli]